MPDNILKISTGNSKTGPSFSLPSHITCPGKTEICAKLCYVQTGRMNLPTSKQARSRQLTSTINLMKSGKFADKLASSINAASVRTIRIHDSGDFMSPAYVRDWIKVCRKLKQVQFWAYTRSFTIGPILNELIKLAKLKNVAIWISCDHDNWLQGLATYKANPCFAGIAFMETSEDRQISRQLASLLPRKQLVIFPVHGHFGRLTHETDSQLPNCPAITKQLPHIENDPACLRCLKCLPNYKGTN